LVSALYWNCASALSRAVGPPSFTLARQFFPASLVSAEPLPFPFWKPRPPPPPPLLSNCRSREATIPEPEQDGSNMMART
jgi:hypothetical protein